MKENPVVTKRGKGKPAHIFEKSPLACFIAKRQTKHREGVQLQEAATEISVAARKLWTYYSKPGGCKAGRGIQRPFGRGKGTLFEEGGNNVFF